MGANIQNMPDSTYFLRYIKLVNDENIQAVLERQCNTTQEFFSRISEEKSLFRYAPGKWSIREIIGHLNDSERIFAYRALRFARNDNTELPSFEENDYVANAHFDDFSLKELLYELQLIRESNLALFKNWSDEELARKGKAGIATLSVRDLLYVIAGHQMHHLNIITERYL